MRLGVWRLKNSSWNHQQSKNTVNWNFSYYAKNEHLFNSGLILDEQFDVAYLEPVKEEYADAMRILSHLEKVV